MSASSAATQPKADLKDWLATFGAILGAFTAILDIQITNSSLANIEGAIGASPEQGSWISTAYLMAEIIVIPLTGWLGSVFGLRRYLSVNTGPVHRVLHRVCPVDLAAAADPVPGRARIHGRRAHPDRHHHSAHAVAEGAAADRHHHLWPYRDVRAGDRADSRWLLTDNLSWHYIFYLNLIPGRSPRRSSSMPCLGSGLDSRN